MPVRKGECLASKFRMNHCAGPGGLFRRVGEAGSGRQPLPWEVEAGKLLSKQGAFCLPYSAPCTRFLCFLLDIASGLHIINKHTQLGVPTTWTPSLLLLRTPSSKPTFLFVWYFFPLKAFYSIEEDQLSVIHEVPQAGTPEHGCRFPPCSGKPSVKVGSLAGQAIPHNSGDFFSVPPWLKGLLSCRASEKC